MKHARHDGDAGPARGAASRLVLPSQHACSCAGRCDLLKVRRSGAGCNPCGSNGDEAGGVLPIGVGSALERQAEDPGHTPRFCVQTDLQIHGPTHHAAMVLLIIFKGRNIHSSELVNEFIQRVLVEDMLGQGFSQPCHAGPNMHLRIYARPCLASCCRVLHTSPNVNASTSPNVNAQ